MTKSLFSNVIGDEDKFNSVFNYSVPNLLLLLNNRKRNEIIFLSNNVISLVSAEF